MSWVAVGVTAATVVTGLVANNSARKASAAQGRSEEAALAEQAYQYDQNREDLAPWRETGTAAQERIRDLLGLGTGASLVKPSSTPNAITAASGGVTFNGPLVDTSTGVPTYNRALYETDPIYKSAWDKHLANHIAQYGVGYGTGSNPDALELGLRDLMSQERQQQGLPTVEQEVAANLETARADPQYGSLNKQFTVADFMNDPVTQLSIDYGRKGIERNLGALGLKKSGLMLKGLEDYAGTKAGESRDRFYQDQDRIFNRLAGVSGSGQTASTTGAALGQQSATNVGNILTAGGNARGAAAIAQGNAWSGALNNIGSWWTQNQMLKQLQNRPTASTSYTPTQYNEMAPS